MVAKSQTIPLRAGVYLRQSIDKTGEELGVSRQRTPCRQIAETKGWQIAEYVDNDLSASKSTVKRPAYLRMLDDISAGTIQAVVCWDLDRLIRQPIELEHFMKLADEKHLALATATGDVDLSTDNGRLFARIKGAVAAAEGERKAARQVARNEQKAASGIPGWAHVPFGFNRDATHVKSEAELIRNAYRSFVAGTGASTIAREWNTLGVKTRRGVEWNARTLTQLLKSARNAGMREHRGVVVARDAWKPIVTEETYLAAMARFSKQAAAHPAPAPGRKYLLSGIARCGVCKGWMGGRPTHNQQRGKHDTAYFCINMCTAMAMEPVDFKVVDLAIQRLARPDATELLIQHDAEDLEALRDEIATCRRRLEALARDFAADDTMDVSFIRGASDGLKARIVAAETKMINAAKAHIFDGLSLGTTAVGPQFQQLDLNRKRAVINTIMTVEIAKGRRGGPKAQRLDLERIRVTIRPTH